MNCRSLWKNCWWHESCRAFGSLVIRISLKAALLIVATVTMAEAGERTNLLSGNSARIQPIGLHGKVVSSLTVEGADYGSFFPRSNSVFAGTRDSGVYRIETFDTSALWSPIGLQGRTVTALSIQHWGHGPILGGEAGKNAR